MNKLALRLWARPSDSIAGYPTKEDIAQHGAVGEALTEAFTMFRACLREQLDLPGLPPDQDTACDAPSEQASAPTSARCWIGQE
jgi:hypothetical protein